jgi:hypothetical protein
MLPKCIKQISRDVFVCVCMCECSNENRNNVSFDFRHLLLMCKVFTLFWDILQLRLVVFPNVLGQPIYPMLKVSQFFSDCLTLKVGPINCPETSVTNCQLRHTVLHDVCFLMLILLNVQVFQFVGQTNMLENL